MNILLTSVGRRTYMVKYFQEALGGKGKLHASNNTKTYAMQIADRAVETPLIYDNSYIDFLINYSLKNNISAIVPLFDVDLPILAKNHDNFTEAGIHVIVSNYQITTLCNDKLKTNKFLKNIGLNAPKTYLSLNNVISFIKNGTLGFPLVVKPRWGMGSIGIFEANNLQELKVLYKKSQRIIFESYLKYESQINPNKNVIIQQKLVGDEYGMDVFNNLQGNFLSCISKKKIEMRGGETNSAKIIKNDKLNKIGVKLSNELKHIGNLDVDCFHIDNKFFILEMNCRFGGQYPFSHISGTNFPKAIIKMLLHKQIGNKLLTAKPGTVGIKDIVPKEVNL